MSYPPRQSDFSPRSSADHYNPVPLSDHALPSSPSPVFGHYADDAAAASPRAEQMARSGSMANTLLSEPDPFASQTGLHARAHPYAGAGTPDSALAGGYGGEKLRKGGRGRYGGAGAGAGGGWWSRKSSAARRWIIIGLVLLVIVIGVAVGAGVGVSEHSATPSAKAASGKAAATTTSTTMSKVAAPSGVPTGTTGSTDWRDAATGGDGSTVYLTNGSSFTYNNSFGGFWNAIPYNNSAQAQLDSPPLSEEWDYQNNLIQGVNIGG